MAKGNLITADVIDEIKQRNEIVSIIEGYVHLTKKSSSNLFGLCPFHSEKTPSFSVSPAKQIYYCFGCHKGGDVVHFIMDIEKLSYIEALRYLAEKGGVSLPESDDAEYRKRTELRKEIYSINTEAARYFYKCLSSEEGKAARNYISRRELEISTIKRFGIGYAPDKWKGLLEHLISKGYRYDMIILSGLVKSSDNRKNDNGYDLFRNRLIFPIFDQMGRIIAFGGRVMDDSLPKYINSPETPVYTKGRHLYGFNIAKTSKAGKMLVVEGYMDLLSIYQAGVDYVVASLGTALTEQQAMLLRNYSEEVIICYDTDAAGQAATMRGLDILKKKGCKVSVLKIKDAKDPDEFIRKHGSERFRAIIDKALPLLDYKLLKAYEDNLKDDILDKIGYQDNACNILAAEENIVVRELYSVRVAENLGVSSDNILAEADRRNRISSKQPVPSGTPAYSQEIKPDEETDDDDQKQYFATREEIMLLCVLAYSNNVFKALKEELVIDDFSEGIMRRIAENAFEMGNLSKLNDTSLLAFGEDYMVNGRKLAELFASGCMKSGEITDETEASEEAKRLNAKIRIRRLLSEKETATEVLASNSVDTKDKSEAKKRLLELTREINKYKSIGL